LRSRALGTFHSTCIIMLVLDFWLADVCPGLPMRRRQTLKVSSTPTCGYADRIFDIFGRAPLTASLSLRVLGCASDVRCSAKAGVAYEHLLQHGTHSAPRFKTVWHSPREFLFRLFLSLFSLGESLDEWKHVSVKPPLETWKSATFGFRPEV